MVPPYISTSPKWKLGITLTIMTYVSWPKIATVKDINDISISLIFQSCKNQHCIDICKGNIDSSLVQYVSFMQECGQVLDSRAEAQSSGQCQRHQYNATLKSIDYNVAMTFILNNNNNKGIFLFQKILEVFVSESHAVNSAHFLELCNAFICQKFILGLTSSGDWALTFLDGTQVLAWKFGLVVKSLVSLNEDELPGARLVPGWIALLGQVNQFSHLVLLSMAVPLWVGTMSSSESWE